MPIDRGFNRLAWLLPYLLGASGLVMIGAAALKWSRRPAARAGRAEQAPVPVDSELEKRLDDELRDLD